MSDEPVHDHVGRGFVAGEQQQRAGAEHLGIAEFGGGGQQAHQVVARFGPTLFEQRSEVLAELGSRCPCHGFVVGAARGTEHHHTETGRPLGEPRPQMIGHTEQASDHRRRQWVGERFDHVDRLAGRCGRRHRVEQVVARGCDGIGERGYGLRGELALQRAA